MDLQTTTYARYTYPQTLIESYENLSFFVGSPRLYKIMSDPGFEKLGQLADVKVGLQTGDNPHYLRKQAGVRGGYSVIDSTDVLTSTELARLTPAEKRDGIDPSHYAGRRFIPYDKGGESDANEGWLPNYYVPTGYFIDWSRSAVQRLKSATVADVKRNRGEGERIKPQDETARAAVIRNPDFYFMEGLTFSDSGAYSPTFRQSVGSAFDQKGSVIIPNTGVDRDILLGVVCSLWARYVYKTFVNHTVSAHVDSIKELPIPRNLSEAQEIGVLVRQIVTKQEANPRYLYHLYEQKEIDRLIGNLYGLTPEDIWEIDLWLCRRYPGLAEAQGVTDRIPSTYESQPSSHQA